MPKRSMIEREKKRSRIAKKGKIIRENLKQIISSIHSGTEERWEAVIKLQKRSRNESESRGQRRCTQCGRPRGVLRRFKLCRCCLRQAWMRGDVPGLTKASW